MRIFPRSQFPPHSHTILAINCVHASNWFTHLHPTRQIDGQNDNSVPSVIYISIISRYIYYRYYKLLLLLQTLLNQEVFCCCRYLDGSHCFDEICCAIGKFTLETVKLLS